MDELFHRLGDHDGRVKDRRQKLDADWQPRTEPDPRPTLLAKYEEILGDAEKRAALIFDLRPRAPVVVKREPSFTEPNAAAHYTVPAPDDWSWTPVCTRCMGPARRPSTTASQFPRSSATWSAPDKPVLIRSAR